MHRFVMPAHQSFAYSDSYAMHEYFFTREQRGAQVPVGICLRLKRADCRSPQALKDKQRRSICMEMQFIMRYPLQASSSGPQRRHSGYHLQQRRPSVRLLKRSEQQRSVELHKRKKRRSANYDLPHWPAPVYHVGDEVWLQRGVTSPGQSLLPPIWMRAVVAARGGVWAKNTPSMNTSSSRKSETDLIYIIYTGP